MEQVIFRIKNFNSSGYWNGNGFGTGGKIYTKRKYARDAMTQGRLGLAIEKGTYKDVDIVKATITDEINPSQL